MYRIYETNKGGYALEKKFFCFWINIRYSDNKRFLFDYINMDKSYPKYEYFDKYGKPITKE